MTTRRTVLLSAAAAAAGCIGLWELMRRVQADPASLAGKGWGPLVPTPDDSTGLPLLRLPEGFRYSSFGWTGDGMDTGEKTPSRHDGMAVVSAAGEQLSLMRNHEVAWKGRPFSKHVPAYDGRTGGGTTRLRFDSKSGAWIDSHPTLSGTFVNCAGGPTPWSSWLTCEEGVVDLDGRLGPLFANRTIPVERQHGYVFEVPADGEPTAQPLIEMGRFRHEAAAVDPVTGVVYMTEDNKPVSGVYRFIPVEPGNLAQGGRLQMSRVKDFDDMRVDVPLRRWLDVDWVDIDDPDLGHRKGTLDSAGVFDQGKRQGATTFSRPEGGWMAERRFYISDTSGGNAGRGQLFVFDPEQQRIQLLFESPAREVLDHPDNISVAPNGMIAICEDPPRGVARVHALSPTGQIAPLAANNVTLRGERNGFEGDFRNSEWTGVCFSPDGRWMFVNVQEPGITFAITGPWEAGLSA